MTTAPLAHSYTPYPMTISHGAGDRIYSTEGVEYFDFYGGHCVASTGHSHPKVVDAIAKQAGQLLFYSTAGDLPIRLQAAKAVIDFIGPQSGIAQVFFCNSGAEANENALKIARLITGRKQLASVSGGWHGRTLGCLSVTDDPKITTPYQDWLLPSVSLDLSDDMASSLAALRQVDFSQIAAVIVEPIQSLAGVRAVPEVYLQALREQTRAAGCMIIFDEIQTGVARLGAPYFASTSSVKPDLVTSAKGLASGIPIGAVMFGSEIAHKLQPADLGSTFGGGPIACAALLATLQVIADEKLLARAEHCEAVIRREMHLHGIEVLGKGLLLGLKLQHAKALKDYAYSEKILLGASAQADVLRLMPPLNVSDSALEALFACIARFKQQHS